MRARLYYNSKSLFLLSIYPSSFCSSSEMSFAPIKFFSIYFFSLFNPPNYHIFYCFLSLFCIIYLGCLSYETDSDSSLSISEWSISIYKESPSVITIPFLIISSWLTLASFSPTNVPLVDPRSLIVMLDFPTINWQCYLDKLGFLI